MRALLPAYATVSLAASLVARILHRGGYLSGWDVLGPALGAHLLATSPTNAAVRALARNTREYWYWSGRNSLLYTLVPGVLNSLAPSAHWGDLVTFLIVCSALVATMAAVGLPWRSAWIVFLAWGCSPSLLSFALRGMPSATGLLPHALALWLVLDRRFRQRPVVTILLGLAWLEVSWQLYEAGRTSLTIFVAAALLLPGASRWIRFIWLALAVAQVWMLRSHKSAVAADVAGAVARMWVPGVLRDDLAAWFDKLFVHPSLSLPTLFVTAVVATVAAGSARRFWLAVFAAQGASVLAIATIDPGQLVARRYLVFEYLCLAATLSLFGDGESVGEKRVGRFGLRRGAVLGLLVVGNLVQLATMAHHFLTPASRQVFPLPFTSAPVDTKTYPDFVEWGVGLERRARSGTALVVLHDRCTHSEWATDPVAVIEQLYLRLGHERFAQSVFVFASPPCRSDAYPARATEDLPATVTNLLDSGREVEVHFRDDFPRDLRVARQDLRARYLHAEGVAEGRGTFLRLVGLRDSPDVEMAICSLAAEAPVDPKPGGDSSEPDLREIAEPPSAEALVNGSFDEFPSEWRSRSRRGDGSTEFSWNPGKNGRAYVSVKANRPDDAAWSQEVRVRRDTAYHVSGWLRPARVEDGGAGATVSVSGAVIAASPGLHGTRTWTRQDLWLRTGPEQDRLTVSCRLGDERSLGTGMVDCSGFSVVPVGVLP